MGQDSTGNKGAGFQWKPEKWGTLPMEMWCASRGNVVRFSWKGVLPLEIGALPLERGEIGARNGNRGEMGCRNDDRGEKIGQNDYRSENQPIPGMGGDRFIYVFVALL